MFKVNLLSHDGYQFSDLEKLQKALSLFEAAMNTERLKSEIVNFSCVLGNKFEDNQGLSNQQVFEKLYAGEEHYAAGINFTADLILVLVKKRKPPFFILHPAIGFGMPGQKEINTYTWWFYRAELYELAGHFAHEWSHKLGFDHSYNPTPTRDFSVPYAFGYMVAEIAKTL
ncbi:hypothetical protein [Mucilaginibacter psychrotolerans]|uniref:Uncharacterized protein n=1 Tax=Mucilaginibacter psychrotolerans TaxID=1524096 RepID=A0A4Y8SE90_9SPHI|nr:hypothetical protein [Mucilaginibacter psychrotolerans]TFF37218.1 hypothetical protein E2R66_12315 [Mucilaginibacter psychrotolerans]